MNRREFNRILSLAGLGLAASSLNAKASAEGNPAIPDAPQEGMSKKGSVPKHDMSGYGIPSGPPQRIAMLLFPKMTALDLVGPHLILAGMGNVEVYLVAKTVNPVVSDNGLTIVPTHTFTTCPHDLTILFTPGGLRGTINAMNDPETLGFLTERGKSAAYITSVCTGSLLLGAAGLLKGYKATSHWAVRDKILPLLSAIPVAERVVRDRNRITGAGVTAGIDFGLTIMALLRNEKHAKASQFIYEYDPQPPFQAGTRKGAGEDVVNMADAMYYPLVEEANAAALQARIRLKTPSNKTTIG